MAERRMFAKTIIDSDAFLEMPLSAQALYFHLGMRADDDGFLNNARKIQQAVHSSDDDLKLLLAKRFLIVFDGGIVVIKHWLINNLIRGDRYKTTIYTDEKALLTIKENGVYTECGNQLATVGIPDGNQLATGLTQDRLGKDRLGEDRQAQEARACPDNFLKNVYEAWMDQEALPRLPALLGFSLSEQARRSMAAWRGNHSDDILAAVRNYGTMAANPRDYWPKTRPGMAGFFEGELFLKCLPANFPASCYTDEKKQAMKWEAGIAKAKRDAEEAGAHE